MKNSPLVAIALSLLVYPGTGHFLVRRWKRGLLWAICFTPALLGVVGGGGVLMSQLVEQMGSPTGDLSLDPSKIALLALAGLGSGLIWVAAAVDTWWVTRPAPARETRHTSLFEP